MAERGDREAFVTLATNDTYALGCLVLGNSLRQRAQTTRKLVVMITPGVTQPMRNQLARVFDMIYDVNLLDSRDAANLQLLGRPDLSVTFTKLHCWRLTMFDKAVFLDADTLVLQNVDELFDREELSAAPDAGWPDCFNSGVFVFRPSEETYDSLLKFAMSQGSFDGGDQGLLNMYFRDWATKDIARHLPFIYNVVSQAFYSYLPAFTQFKDSVKIVHFIGATKPWHHPYNTATKEVTPLPETGHNKDYLQIWWDIFMSFVQPTLDPSLEENKSIGYNMESHCVYISTYTFKTSKRRNSLLKYWPFSCFPWLLKYFCKKEQVGGLIGELASLSLQTGATFGGSQSHLSEQERKLNWERGQVDYLGADKFENIKEKLDKSMKGPATSTKTYTSSLFSTSVPVSTTSSAKKPVAPKK
ncbi:glycogenin-1 isoform X2 [Magallana gigas]|uniref:glycogenin-1 isoform X2 n=1 Tax=Magallana gigas TaxID=29159 RepID=UPI0033413C2E